jgi:hypothetical protein
MKTMELRRTICCAMDGFILEPRFVGDDAMDRFIVLV